MRLIYQIEGNWLWIEIHSLPMTSIIFDDVSSGLADFFADICEVQNSKLEFLDYTLSYFNATWFI